MIGRARRRLHRQEDMERGSDSRLALNGDAAAMVAYYGLRDGEAEAGSVLFGGVIRREEATAFLRRESSAGIGNFEMYAAVLWSSSQHENAASGHRIHRVHHQILERALEQARIRFDHGQFGIEMELGRDRRA